jgi:hypothetical protein
MDSQRSQFSFSREGRGGPRVSNNRRRAGEFDREGGYARDTSWYSEMAGSKEGRRASAQASIGARSSAGTGAHACLFRHVRLCACPLLFSRMRCARCGQQYAAAGSCEALAVMLARKQVP